MLTVSPATVLRGQESGRNYRRRRHREWDHEVWDHEVWDREVWDHEVCAYRGIDLERVGENQRAQRKNRERDERSLDHLGSRKVVGYESDARARAMRARRGNEETAALARGT